MVVANKLNKDVSQIDSFKPLSAYGADELDLVELIFELEDAFGVEIPDNAIEDTPGDAMQKLTVAKFADALFKLLKAN